MNENAARRRWMSRPRSLRAGFMISVVVHAGIVVVFVTIWNLLPLPPIRPIKVFALPNAPSRGELGITPDGRLVLDSSGTLR